MDLFDPLGPGMLEDPYAVYARLRSEDPVHWHALLGAWVVSTYRDCLAILKDSRAFSCDFRKIGETVPEEFLSIQTIDPPLHEALRRPLIVALKRMGSAEWASNTVATFEIIIRDVDQDGFDFIEFAERISSITMCTFLGIPVPSDEEALRSAQRDLILSMDAGLAPERASAGVQARAALSEMIRPWIESPPERGLIRHVDFDQGTEIRSHLVNSLRNFFVAGYSSVSSTLGNVTEVLLRHGLLSGSQKVDISPVAFNELVRYGGAVQAVSRAVTDDTSLPSGRRLGKGDVVVAVLASANRDPTAFVSPDEIRLDRSPIRHLGFGQGAHACTGAQLAVSLGVRVLDALTSKYLVLSAGPPVRRPSGTLRGLDLLPVRLIPR